MLHPRKYNDLLLFVFTTMFDIHKIWTKHFTCMYGNCSSMFTLTFYLILLHSVSRVHYAVTATVNTDSPPSLSKVQNGTHRCPKLTNAVAGLFTCAADSAGDWSVCRPTLSWRQLERYLRGCRAQFPCESATSEEADGHRTRLLDLINLTRFQVGATADTLHTKTRFILTFSLRRYGCCSGLSC